MITVEVTGLACHLGVKDDLQQKVAQFAAKCL